jgi:hypothetical protein
MRRALSLLIAVLLVAQPALAGSQAVPEIDDESGDVDAQHLVDVQAPEQGAGTGDVSGDETLEDETSDLPDEEVPDDQESSADILKAWVDRETEDSFVVNVEVADLPEELEVSAPLVEIWTHFTVREGDYHTVARLSAPDDGGPTEASYELYQGDSRQDDLLGNVDAETDIVSMRVAKADVRDPGGDDALTDFHATTHVADGQAVLDYAPGANETSLPDAGEDDGAEPTDLSVDPRYGADYGFTSFEDETSRISLSLTPGSLEVDAGQTATFAVTVDNDAEASDTVTLSSWDQPSGWDVDVEPSQLAVDAKSSETAELVVTPASDAEGQELVHVQATSDRGADKEATVSVTALSSDDGSSSSDDGDDGDAGDASSEDDDAGDGDDTQASEAGDGSDAEPSDEADEIPVVSPLAVVASIAGLVVARKD